MVKGLSKRVVVVRFEDTRVFEQAILLLRDGIDAGGVDEQQLLREAGEVAEQYQRDRECRKAKTSWVARFFAALAGAGVVGLIWLATAA